MTWINIFVTNSIDQNGGHIPVNTTSQTKSHISVYPSIPPLQDGASTTLVVGCEVDLLFHVTVVLRRVVPGAHRGEIGT